MEDLSHLEEHINTVLLLSSVGLDDDELKKTIKEEGLDDKTVDFVFDTTLVILEEAAKHIEAVGELYTDDDQDNDAEIEAYLRQQGVHEHLIGFVHVYISYTFTILASGQLIEEGRAKGKNDDQLISEIKDLGHLDDASAQMVFNIAVQQNSEESMVRANPEASGGKMMFRAFIWLVIGILDFQIEDDGFFFGYIAIGIAIILFVIGLYRFSQE